jgi:hypothetical protein
MDPLPNCKCGGAAIVRWNPIRQCWDALCDSCPAGFWGLTMPLAKVEWGRAMRSTTYSLDAEPMRLGLRLGE